jgi:hypothetical protein
MTSESARTRALQAQAERLQQQIDRQRADAQRAQQTAYYAGGGRYRQPGGNGGYLPRGNVTSGGVPIGAEVPANGGIVGGMPAGGAGADLRALEDRIAEVAYNRGPQVGDGNPNNLDGKALAPRFPQDLFYDDAGGVLYRYQLGSSGTGEWVEMALGGGTEALDFRIEAPTNTSYVLSAYQHYAVRIESLLGVSGATVSVSPGIGATADVGAAISVTVTGSTEGTPVLGSILLRRV